MQTKGWLRLFLPGVFVECQHWQERAERAEARLSELVSQVATALAHEKELHDARERELLNQILVRTTSQKPPEPEEGDGGIQTPAVSEFIHPFARKYQEFLSKEANALPDETVNELVDEHLRQKAIF